MRSAIRLVVALVALVAGSTVALCLGVAGFTGATGPTLPGGLATVSPVLAPSGPAGESSAATTAVAWALARLGTPYRWGGEGVGGFDCSGLVQAAYGAAGVRLPRVAQDQYDAGPHLADGTPLNAGDLVFFGSGPGAVDHVGIALGTGEMIDAPHTGAVVRVEPIFARGYIGATRPAP